MLSKEQIPQSLPEIRYPEELPVSQRRDEIKRLIAANQVVIVCGETGSGKTTQLPKMCLELGRGLNGQSIVHTQPRRLAATATAKRIAQELNSEIGQWVGLFRFLEKSKTDDGRKNRNQGIPDKACQEFFLPVESHKWVKVKDAAKLFSRTKFKNFI